MKHIVDCVVELQRGAEARVSDVLHALAPLGLQPARSFRCPADPLSVHVVGEFHVLGRAQELPRSGAEFLRTCVFLKTSQRLADEVLPARLLEVRVDGQAGQPSRIRAA